MTSNLLPRFPTTMGGAGELGFQQRAGNIPACGFGPHDRLRFVGGFPTIAEYRWVQRADNLHSCLVLRKRLRLLVLPVFPLRGFACPLHEKHVAWRADSSASLLSVCVCVCVFVTPNDFKQGNGVRYDTSPLYSSVHTAASVCVRGCAIKAEWLVHGMCVCVCLLRRASSTRGWGGAGLWGSHRLGISEDRCKKDRKYKAPNKSTDPPPYSSSR